MLAEMIRGKRPDVSRQMSASLEVLGCRERRLLGVPQHFRGLIGGFCFSSNFPPLLMSPRITKHIGETA